MKKMGIILVPLLMLTLTIGSVGCSGDGGVYLHAAEMKLIPAEATGAMYLDLDLLMNDEALEGVAESMGFSADDEELKDFGIEIYDMDSIVVALRDDEEAGVAVGQFDFDSVRLHLELLEFTHTSYKGVDFWVGYYDEYGDTSVAFFSDALAWGDLELVESIVRTIKGEADSFEDLAEVKEVLNRFPERTAVASMVVLDAVTELGAPPGVKNGGFMVTEEGGYLKYMWAFNCIDEPTALEMEYQWSDGLESTTVRRDGTWVIVEEEISTEEFNAEAQNTEYRSIQTGISNMMLDNGLTSLPQPQTIATNDMTQFPDTSVCETDKLLDVYGTAFTLASDGDYWVLYGCDRIANAGDLPADRVNYVSMATTAYWYTVDMQGNVTQYSDAAGTHQTNPSNPSAVAPSSSPTPEAVVQAKSGDTVSVHYTGTLDDGTVFDSSIGGDPLQFTIGSGEMIPGFEQAVIGMKVDESKTVKIPADEAYGPYMEEWVFTVPRDEVPENIDPQLGQMIGIQMADGSQVYVLVTEITESYVTLDANSPLAGEDLTFEVQLVEIA